MGCDLMAYVNHKLDTSCIENLAADLSDRLTAKIRYGNFDEQYDFVEKGCVGEHTQEYELTDWREASDGPDKLIFCLNGKKDGQEYYEMTIYRDCFLSGAFYMPGRFRTFSSNFKGTYDSWEKIIDFRKQVKEEADKLGGNIAIYTGNQCGADYVGYEVETTAFHYVLNRVKAIAKVTDISQFFRHSPKSYLKEDPDAFIDDFSYMPGNS